MRLSKNLRAANSSIRQVLVISLLVGGLFAAWFIYGRVWTHLTQISKEEAEAVCQDLYNEVESGIKSVEGYEILGSHKGCTPYKNAEGGTYYSMGGDFRVSKAGNDTVEGMKDNINNLADQYSSGKEFRTEDKGYTIWVDNDEGIGGQPDTICVSSSMLIFSSGAPYDSSLTKVPGYREPVSRPEHNAPCSEISD